MSTVVANPKSPTFFLSTAAGSSKPSKFAKPRIKPEEVVCLLSRREALGYEKNGNCPSCLNHPHISIKVADELIYDDVARWVGGPGTKVMFARAIMKLDIYREWRNKPSGPGYTVRQLVRIKGHQPHIQNTVQRPKGQLRPPSPFDPHLHEIRTLLED